jgi:hypothetical protein
LAAAHFYLCTGQLRTCSPSFGFTFEKKKHINLNVIVKPDAEDLVFFYNKRFHYRQQEAVINLTEFKVT